ncbi:MAG: hypothetical protein ACYSXF_00995 [Planctomycetota bacterium]|jgi:hypothetical protein
MNKLIAPLVAAAALCHPAAAGTLKHDWVAADAQWLIHVDVEAFTASTFGSTLLQHAEELHVDLGGLDEMKEEIGLDPRTDLMSVTAYGTTGDIEEDAAIIAVTNAKADEALARFKAHEDTEVREIRLDGHTVHVFSDGDEQHYLHLRETDDPDRRLVVICGDKHVLADALDVLDGNKPSMSRGRSSFLVSRAKRGSFVFIAARDVDGFPEIEPASEIIRLADGFAVDIGEKEDVVYGQATVSAENEQTARDIADVVTGMIALGRLLGSQEPELEPLRELAQALAVTADGTRISIRLQYDSQQLVEELKAVAEHEHDLFDDGDCDDDDDGDNGDDDNDDEDEDSDDDD